MSLSLLQESVPGPISAVRAVQTVGRALLPKQGTHLLLGVISRLKGRLAQAFWNWIGLRTMVIFTKSLNRRNYCIAARR